MRYTVPRSRRRTDVLPLVLPFVLSSLLSSLLLGCGEAAPERGRIAAPRFGHATATLSRAAAASARGRLLGASSQEVAAAGDGALHRHSLAAAAALEGTPAGAAFPGRGAPGEVPLAQMSNRRIERGAGRVPVDRLRYPVDQAQGQLAHFRHVILVGTREPTAFFAYPGKPSLLAPQGSAVHTLARPQDDLVDALERLAERVGAAGETPVVASFEPPPAPTGLLSGDKIAAALAGVLPEGAIVADESVSVGRNFFQVTRNARPHSWLQVTGGAIGCGLPLATGAAVACPDRPVVCLEADGSAMYTLQALWTQAREGLDVTTLILANQSYAILKGEMANVGARNPGRKALDMLSLDRPTLDWVGLARGMGVEGERVEDAAALAEALGRGLATPGPYLVEAVF